MGYLGSAIDGDGSIPSSGTGGAGGSGAQRNTAMGKLPRQHDRTPYVWSLARDTQLRELLGAGLAAGVGQGFLSAQVVQDGPLGIKLLAGARLYSGGVVFSLGQDAIFNGVPSSGRTVFWVNLVRTPPTDPKAAAALDSYDLEVGGGLLRPTDTHLPVALITSSGGSITDIDEDPYGKWLGKRPVEIFTTLAVGGSGVIDVDHSAYFTRYDVGHTRVKSIDQDGVTAVIDLNSISETGFLLELTSAGVPSVDLYGSNTQLKIVVECWGRFSDA